MVFSLKPQPVSLIMRVVGPFGFGCVDSTPGPGCSLDRGSNLEPTVGFEPTKLESGPLQGDWV